MQKENNKNSSKSFYVDSDVTQNSFEFMVNFKGTGYNLSPSKTRNIQDSFMSTAKHDRSTLYVKKSENRIKEYGSSRSSTRQQRLNQLTKIIQGHNKSIIANQYNEEILNNYDKQDEDLNVIGSGFNKANSCKNSNQTIVRPPNDSRISRLNLYRIKQVNQNWVND